MNQIFQVHQLCEFALSTTPSNQNNLMKLKPPPSTYRDLTSIRKKSIEREVNHTMTTDFLRENIRDKILNGLELGKQILRKKNKKESLDARKKNSKNAASDKFSPLKKTNLRRLSNAVADNFSNNNKENNPNLANCCNNNNLSFNPSEHQNNIQKNPKEIETKVICGKNKIKKAGHQRTNSAVIGSSNIANEFESRRQSGNNIALVENPKKANEIFPNEKAQALSKTVFKLDLLTSNFRMTKAVNVCSNLCNTTTTALGNNNTKNGNFLNNNQLYGPNIHNNRDGNGRVVKLNSRRVSLGDTNQGEYKNQKLILPGKLDKRNKTPNFDKERGVERDILNYSHRVFYDLNLKAFLGERNKKKY